ncbi:ribonuclease Z [Clostridium septicum]|uniref:Ribonuclease Z n=1 Tax=Clostridium septicum TaxID=1504 RepID=A0A9N7JMQ2_CLOSE|nr:ribonuclease Z [Clostridium septicum]AYE35534.1 ribonuclease [Clostridium septicum]MDU1314588.1 ribonuclease Z [Clostridium septicum]QAS60921.1 ribonuclease Z [Clostridium septicum]UEC19805.1 ribonuclease Z [Clostridium septicum]USS02136.1 ribonuclease Z [Clostridium septicum]
MLDICLLGTGGGMPMPFRGLSATLISYKGRKILIDCGEGTQVSMRMIGWGFKSIDIICITHVHGDHIIGLTGLLSTIGNSGRTEKLTIIGPKGINKVVNGLRVIVEYLPYELEIIEYPREVNFKLTNNGLEVSESGDITLSTLDLEHSAPCLGYKIYFKRNRKFNVEKAIENNVPKILWSKLQKEEKACLNGIEYLSDMVLGEERKGIYISVITDTRPIESIKDFVKYSDLFICEGTYGKDEDIEKAIKNRHMTFREAATLAKDGSVKTLLLTHFTPAMMNPDEYINNAKEVFKNTIIAKDRLIINLKFEE